MSDPGLSALPPGQHLLATPAGALRAASGDASEVRALLRALLRRPVTVATAAGELASVVPGAPLEVTAHRLAGLERLGLISCESRAWKLGGHKLEDVLPRLLHRLSAEGRGMLADDHGFAISSAGFPADGVPAMAALAAEVAALDARWRREGTGVGASEPPCWASSLGSGGAPLSFRLLTIGPHRFVLVLEGAERLADPALVWLVWALSHRYDAGDGGPATSTS